MWSIKRIETSADAAKYVHLDAAVTASDAVRRRRRGGVFGSCVKIGLTDTWPILTQGTKHTKLHICRVMASKMETKIVEYSW